MAGTVREVHVAARTASFAGAPEHDGDVDAFVASARPVAAAYSAGLPSLGLQGWRTSVELTCGWPSGDGRVHVVVSVDRVEEMERVGVALTPGTASWPAEGRTRLALAVLHRAMLRLGEARGWDGAHLQRLHDITAAGLGFPERADDLPEVVAVGSGLTASDEPPRIVFVGAGPTNGVSRAYCEALGMLVERLTAEEGQAWWQGSGIKELEVSAHYGPGPDVRSRRSGDRLRAEIRRPAASTHTDPDTLARQDVSALLAEVRRKTGLGPHPVLEG